MPHDNEARLGNVHGVWIWLIKAALVLMPGILAWHVWVTATLYRNKSSQDLALQIANDKIDAVEIRSAAAFDQKLSVLATAIKEDLHAIKITLGQMPMQVPPDWWEQWVREQFRAHDERLKTLERNTNTEPRQP